MVLVAAARRARLPSPENRAVLASAHVPDSLQVHLYVGKGMAGLLQEGQLAAWVRLAERDLRRRELAHALQVCCPSRLCLADSLG